MAYPRVVHLRSLGYTTLPRQNLRVPNYILRRRTHTTTRYDPLHKIQNGMKERFVIYTVSKRGGQIQPPCYFPLTAEGLEKAKAKRSELMARYLEANVELEIVRL